MRHVGDGADEVLAVVEEQEQLLGAQVVDERVERGLPGLRLDPQGAPDLRDHEICVAERRELDQPGAVALAIEAIRRSLQREPRLAGAAHADQRHQATGRQEPRDVRQLPLAPNERGDLEREVRGMRRGGAQRRELAPQSRRDELVDVLGPVQVAQPMLAQVDQLRTSEEGRRRPGRPSCPTPAPARRGRSRADERPG